MEFVCSQQDLSKALNIVSKAISNKTTIPILKGILLEVDSFGKLKLTTSDMDLSIEKEMEVTTIKEGSVVVSAKLFLDIIRKLPQTNVEITYSNGQVKIKTQGSEFNIVGQSAEEYPKISKIEEIKSINLNKELLKEMIRKTSFAASIEEAKGIIVGVLLEIEEEKLSMVALDGFRMAVAREKIERIDNISLIITARILNEINKIFAEDEEDEEVKVVLDEQKAVFILKNTRIISRIMEGDFIKYKDLLPKENITTVKVNRGEMIDCLDRASLLAREGRNNLVRVATEGNKMMISSRSEEGNVKEELFIDKKGEDLEIGFNAKYLLEVFKAVNHEEVNMGFNNNISPCIIKPLEGDEFEYLILPVRISGVS